MNTNEKERLDIISQNQLFGMMANRSSTRYCYNVFRRYMRLDSNILEIGPADGFMTDLLVKDMGRHAGKLTVVEGSSIFCQVLREKHLNINIVNSLFEEFQTDDKYSAVILGHVLEHVENPVDVLCRVKKLLGDDGRIFASVPNARSLHRQAAVIMGILEGEDALNEADKLHGHRIVFSPEKFRKVFLDAKLNIEIFGGYWIKPVSNKQIEMHWTPEMLDAFMCLGERYPDIAGELYIIAKNQ